MRVVIVGAGLAGRSAAHALLARGVRPTVLAPDRGDSAFGAGILSAQFGDADLRAAARRSARIVAGLVPVNRCGHAQIATTVRGARTLDGLVDVRPSMPRALERALAPEYRRRIVRAVFAREDLCLDVERLLRVLGQGARFLRGRALALRDGAVLRDGRAIEADRVLVACGAASPRLVGGALLRLERRPARRARVDVALPAMLHVVESGFYARPAAAGAIAGDGSIEAIRREARRVFGSAVRCRADGGGATLHARDGRPVLRRVSETTWVLTALGGDGLALGPAFGEKAAEALLGAAGWRG